MESVAEKAPRQAASAGDLDPVEADLLGRARKGDLGAFDEMVRRYQRRVYGVAMRILRRHQVADDVTQDAFIRAYEALGSFDLSRPFGPWITRIVSNLAINQLRSPRWREDELPEGHAETSSSAADPLEQVLEGEARRLLAEALGTLPVEQRTVFVLRTAEEMSYQQIAETLDISPGTVMSRLSRAREKLRLALKPYLGRLASQGGGG